VTYLLPVVAIVLGVLVLGETVTVAALAGIRAGAGRRGAHPPSGEVSHS